MMSLLEALSLNTLLKSLGVELIIKTTRGYFNEPLITHFFMPIVCLYPPGNNHEQKNKVITKACST